MAEVVMYGGFGMFEDKKYNSPLAFRLGKSKVKAYGENPLPSCFDPDLTRISLSYARRSDLSNTAPSVLSGTSFPSAR